MFACADAGIIFVPLNTRWAVSELRHAVVDSGIKVVAILDRESADLVLELSSPAPAAGGPHLSWLLVGPLVGNLPTTSGARSEGLHWRKIPVGPSDRTENIAEREEMREWNDAHSDVMYDPVPGEDKAQHGFVDGPICRHHSVQGAGRAAVVPDDTQDIFCIVHTSGSTGRSKGVALTHLGQVWIFVAHFDACVISTSRSALKRCSSAPWPRVLISLSRYIGGFLDRRFRTPLSLYKDRRTPVHLTVLATFTGPISCASFDFNLDRFSRRLPSAYT